MKKFTGKSSKKTKYLFVARGPGEAGQARALADYISKKGGKILFSLHQKEYLFFLSRDKQFKIFVIENPKALKKIAEKEKPDVLLLFNSKMWGGEFSENPGFKKPKLCLAIDSNWLFNDKKYPRYPFVKWVDRYLVLFPKKIFELGLKERGGDFILQKNILKKVIPVGFMPSYEKPHQKTIAALRKKYNLGKQEKLIFSYFSGFGAGHRIFAFENLVSAVEKLVARGRKIKVLYLGPTKDLDPAKLKKDWLVKKESLPAEEYFLTLASSDLVFQHQGMVTLAQAISVQIPAICNVHILKDEDLPKIHFWEVRPFAKVGACKMFSKSTPIKKISQEINNLLFNRAAIKKMTKAQESILENGEANAFSIIKKLTAKKICEN